MSKVSVAIDYYEMIDRQILFLAYSQAQRNVDVGHINVILFLGIDEADFV